MDIELNEEQQRALNIMNSGENVFLTGDAGTGKSVLINTFIKTNKLKNIVVCAPTGKAALNVGGATIHRTFGIKDLKSVLEKVKSCPDVIKYADTLIIDEISMCRLDLFDYISRVLYYKLEKYGRHTQLIVVGDFFQLSPVVTVSDRPALEAIYGYSQNYFCFNSTFWPLYHFILIKLTTVIRQDDIEFKRNLTKAKYGDTSCISYFNQNVYKDVSNNTLYLASRNKEVQEINQNRLDMIDMPEHIYTAKITNVSNSELDAIIDRELVLKESARVMCLVNNTAQGYVNGSLGTVLKCNNNSVLVKLDNGDVTEISRNTFEFYEYGIVTEVDDEGNVIHKLEKILRGTVEQLPLKLAYAITIHKSQGQTFDSVCIFPKVFTTGQLYVALSRCKSFDNLSLTSEIQPWYLKVNPEVVRFYNFLERTNANE